MKSNESASLLFLIEILFRNELIINLRFWLDLFVASLVKKPRDSPAIPTFFALLATKISNPKFLIY